MSNIEIAEAQLGEDVKAFLETDVGRLIVGRAAADEDAAKNALVALDPYEFTTLVELQNALALLQREVRVGQTIAMYLDQAIVNGDVAWQNLNTREDEPQ